MVKCLALACVVGGLLAVSAPESSALTPPPPPVVNIPLMHPAYVRAAAQMNALLASYQSRCDGLVNSLRRSVGGQVAGVRPENVSQRRLTILSLCANQEMALQRIRSEQPAIIRSYAASAAAEMFADGVDAAQLTALETLSEAAESKVSSISFQTQFRIGSIRSLAFTVIADLLD